MNKMLRKFIFIIILCCLLVIPVFSDTCILTHNAQQSVSAGANPIYNTENSDLNNMHSTSNSPARINITKSGYYLCIFSYQLNGNPNGQGSAKILINNSQEIAYENIFNNIVYYSNTLSGIAYINSGSYVTTYFGNAQTLGYDGIGNPLFAVSSIDNSTTSSGGEMTSDQFDLLTALLIIIVMLLGCVSFIKIFDYIMAEKEDK
jgi:hypothetical protein